MEPVTLVVTALAAGAAAGVGKVASTAISDAYQSLKTLVVGLLRRFGTAEQTSEQLVQKVGTSEQDENALAELLTRFGVDDPTKDAAQELLDLIDAQKGRKFVVDASQAKGVQIGDHTVQHNTFN